MTGDIRELVIRACRTVGRPIFFSVLIMLLSFIPVFMLSGREGKLFHPLAFTKSFAMIGVALISVTVVPALIPTFIKGRLRSEEENWIVRSFINIYKPLLTWALPRRNLVMWMFAVLLVLAAGMFPAAGHRRPGGLARRPGKIAFLVVFGLVTALDGDLHARLALAGRCRFVSLMLLGLVGLSLPEDRRGLHAALDEGTTLDMPITVPRASVTQSADDLKARDALLRGFPEVESVIGKAGRADTPTDPAPLDMVETFVNFRPKELWPKRVLKFDDAARQTREVLAGLGGAAAYVQRAPARGRPRQSDQRRHAEGPRAVRRNRCASWPCCATRNSSRNLSPLLTRFAVAETIRRIDEAGRSALADRTSTRTTDDRRLGTASSRREFGPWLAKNPALEDVTRPQPGGRRVT